MEFVLLNASSKSAALFSMIAWCVWQRRNRIREKQPTWEVVDIVKTAAELLQEFHDVQKQSSRNIIQRDETCWKTPNPEIYKINFDGAIFEDSELVGLGVVIRDSAGLIIAALNQKICLPSSLDLEEAMAASRALSFAREISIFQVESGRGLTQGHSSS